MRTRDCPYDRALVIALLLLLITAMGTDDTEPVDVCDSYPEYMEPAPCARDHWAN